MSDNIVFLTPMGQYLRSRQKEMGLTDEAMSSFLRISKKTYTKLLVKPLERHSPASIKKVCEACGISQPPIVPEDLNPLDSVVWPFDSKKKIHLAKKFYYGLKQTGNVHDMQQFVVNFGNKLMTVLSKYCDNILAMELHTRASMAIPPYCIIEVFAESKTLTKLRIVLSYSKAAFLHCDVHEIHQRDNTFVSGIISDTFSNSVLNSLITKAIPDFCGAKKKIYMSPLDRVLSKK